VTIERDGDRITKTSTEAVRSPWTTCGDGATAIAAMVGLTVDEACDPRTWGADRSRHCTHVGDLTLIAIRHARDREPLRYQVRIWPAARTHRTASLERNGTEVMRWDIEGTVVAGPPPWDGVPLERGAFLPWIRATFDAAGEEQAMILRRASSIAIGNAFDLDAYPLASDVHPADNTCHTYRPEIAFTARRRVGSSRALEWT
jgi:hypothetical protein